MTVLRLACLYCLLNTLASVACAQTELEGTLFTSPEQRAYLDYLRQDFLARSRERGFDISTTEIPDIPTGDNDEEDSAPVVHRLGGIVTLRDGTQRIWLNGQALGESELPDGFRLVRENGMPALRFTTDSGIYVLRPGQTLEVGTGRIAENYHRPQPESVDVTSTNLHTEFEEGSSDPEPKAAPDDAEIAVSEAAAPEDEAPSIDELQARLEMLERAQFGADDDD